MAKKTKAGKLPKELLGVKLPKELRKAGERLIEQAQGPAGRQAIAGALTAVAGAAVTAVLARAGTKAAAAAPAPAAPAEPEPRADARPAGDVGESVARAAEALIAGLFERRR